MESATFKLRALVVIVLVVGTACAQGIRSDWGGLGGGGAGGFDGYGGYGGSTPTTSTTSDAGPDAQGPCVGAAECVSLTTPCAEGACINGKCGTLPKNEGAPCDDGKYCTTGEKCTQGQCGGGYATSCPTQTQCTVGTCNTALDQCVEQPGNEGYSCSDYVDCVDQGYCSGGVCTGGYEPDCSFFDTACSLGACEPGTGCTKMPLGDGAACDDGMFCTVGETCLAGTCQGGQPNPCAPPGGCFIASCDENTDACTAIPGNDGAPCDDFSPCTVNTTCSNGVCTGGAPANEGAACDDGASCTQDTVCVSGQCAGGTGPTVYFADDFSDNAAGWILGNEWQIGSATASVGASLMGDDPATDHTATADNGIAGVVIGGMPQQVLHDFYYLESPPFDTANAAGQVILGFYRWLDSDYQPYMVNTIDVWNGSTWENLWASSSSATVDNPAGGGQGWTYVEHDLTTYKNSAMKIRFGFMIGSSGVYYIGSWNIDDVLVASASCP